MNICFKTDDIKNVKVIAEITYHLRVIGPYGPFSKVIFFCGDDYVKCNESYNNFINDFKKRHHVMDIKLIQLFDNEFTVQNVD